MDTNKSFQMQELSANDLIMEEVESMSERSLATSQHSLCEVRAGALASAKLKLNRAMTKLKVILFLCKHGTAKRSFKARARLRSIIRKVITVIQMRRKRRYPNISNEKARRAILRLMILIRLKRRKNNVDLRRKWRLATTRLMFLIRLRRGELKKMKKEENELFAPVAAPRSQGSVAFSEERVVTRQEIKVIKPGEARKSGASEKPVVSRFNVCDYHLYLTAFVDL